MHGKSSSSIDHIFSVAQDIPLLNTGINNTGAGYDEYPTKEHYTLLNVNGQEPNTTLNSMLTARHIKVPSDPKDPNYRHKAKLLRYKENARSLTFRGHRNAPVPLVEWESYYLHVLPLVIEHPKRLLTESKQLSKTLGKILKTSADLIGHGSTEQQALVKTRCLCVSLLADHPWQPAEDEDAQVQSLVLEDMGINTTPRRTEDTRTYDNLIVQYKRALSFIRELMNHTFLRFLYATSTRQAQLEYKEVLVNFLNEQATAPSDPPVKFTAQHIIDYIKSTCTCSNDKSLQSIRNSILQLTRHKRESPIKWFFRFQPYIIRYNKANKNVSLDTTTKGFVERKFLETVKYERNIKHIDVSTQIPLSNGTSSHRATF